MFRKTLTLFLVSVLINVTAINCAFAESKEDKQARFAQKVKAGISELGTGEEVYVEVRLHDKTNLKGYVKEIGSESFLLADATSGAVTTVHYPQVKKVKAYNLSTGAKVAIGLGIAATVLFFLMYILVD